MRKKFTMLLASLFLFGLGTMNAQVTKYYKPGERKTTLTAGDKVMFYNTAFNGNEDRTGFLVDNGSSFGHSKQKPSASPLFSEKVGVWAIEVAEDNTTYYKVNVKGVNGYVGIGGKTNNGSAQDMYIHQWTEIDANKRAGVNSEQANGTVVGNANITADDNVWLVANGATASAISNTWNGNTNGFATWSTGHPYAIYSIVEAETADLEAYLANAKTTAKNTLTDLAKLSLYETTAAVANVEAVALVNDDLETALNTIDEIVLNVKKSIDGKNVKFCNKATDVRGGKYLGYDNANNRAAAIDNNGDAVIWTIKTNSDGTFKLYNFVNDLYLGTPGANSGGGTPMHATESDAPSFYFIPTAENVVALATTGGKMVHVNNGNNYRIIQYWSTTDAASLWDVTSVPAIVVDHETLNSANAAAATLLYSIQQAYGTTDVAKYTSNAKESAEGSYAGLLDGQYNDPSYFHSTYNSNPGDYHYLQVEVSEGVKDFYFYFKKRQGNNNNRPTEIEILGSTDGSAFTSIKTISSGLPTNASVVEYLSDVVKASENVKYIRFVVKATSNEAKDKGGVYPFFTFSEFYVLPATNDVVALLTAYNNFASLSITSNDMAAAAAALINAETTLALSNIKKEANALLIPNESNHATTPNLGQYTTEAYEALVAARDAADATEESIREAISAFKASQNKPVYIIKSAWDTGYPKGSAILYNGSAWRWATANKFNKQMWMTIPGYTQTNVPVVDAYDANGTSYAICDYLTGAKMRGKDVQIVKIANWEGAYNLQYNADATSTDAAHHAKDNGELVSWKPAVVDNCQASAWRVEYIGSTYELAKLSDELFTEAASLAAVNVPTFTFGTKMNQYAVSSQAALDAAVANRTTVLSSLSSTVEQITAAKTQLETAIASVQLNMPIAGHYYRLRCTGEGLKRLQSTTVQKAENDIRLEMQSGDEGINDGSIFRYTKGGLKSCVENKFIDAYRFVADGANIPQVTFSAAANGAVGCYNIKIGERYIYGAGDYIDSGAGTPDTRAGYNWWLEEADEVVISNYKNSAISALNTWASLSVLFDAELVATAKTAVESMGVTQIETLAAIDAEMKAVTDDMADKMVSFKNCDTQTSARIDAYLAANSSTNKGYGTKPFNYNAIWKLVSDGHAAFYLHNELNNVYLKNPSSGELTANVSEAAAYTFEFIADANAVELHSGSETLHLTNNCELMTYDNNDPASRWAISTVNIAADITKLLSTLTENDYAEVPELGQYTKEAYDALKLAETTAKTVDEVEHAIAAFKASQNMPVYIITNAWDAGYCAGAAIYYDGAWKWKKANRYDRQMWMTIPEYTEEGVPAPVDEYNANNTSYGFCDYLTGTKIRGKEGVQLVKITGWPDAYSLQYAASGQDAAHHAQSGGALVNWHPAQVNDRQPSAWRVEYIGNTYDLKDLTDEQLAALAEAQAAFESKIYLFDAVFGDGVGQYQGEENDIKNTLFEVAPFLSLKLNVLKEKTVDEINAWTTSLNEMPVATINMPTDGYYRIYGANSNATPSGQYITGHTNADGGRIALTSEADASTIYYYANGKLQAYQSGKYIGLNNDYYVFADDTHPASAIEFAASSYIAGAYLIKSADRYLHYKVYEGNVEIDRCGAEESANDSWYLEKLEKETIIYTYKAGETVLATQEVKEFAGMPYPAANVALPLGYTATALTGNIVKGETAKEIVCEFDKTLIPFEYADSYDAVETGEYWYYLKFDSNNGYYLHHTADQGYIALDSKSVDKKNKDVYSWGFVGTPSEGFQIVNRATGSTMILSSSTTMSGTTGDGTCPIMTKTPVPEGNNSLWIPTASTDAEGGFYLAQKGFPNNRLNNRGKLAYWTEGAGSGSTFVVEARPFGAVAELEALIVEAEKLKTDVDANTGDKIGEYSEETASALVTAITTAQSKGDAATAEDVAALQAVLDATKIILPTAGQYYQIHSSYFSTTMAVYSNGSNAMWKALNADDESFYWKAVATEDGFALMNAADEKYIQAGWSVADDAKNVEVKILAKADDAKGYRYGIFMNNGQMHANGHGNGAGTYGNLVNYVGGADGASSWYIVPVELPTFCDIVYVFKHDGVAVDKYTQKTSLKAGAAYPAVQVPTLPYGVSTDAATPEGNVTESKTFEFTLTVDKALPFETTTDPESEDTKWYYMQMHVFDKSYMKYIQDCGTYIEWNDLAVADEEIDSHLWCFVGDLWNGVKVVNKATKNAIVSTDGVASMGTEGTAFMPTASDNSGHPTYFCLQNPNSKYLNAQKAQDEEVGKVKHWTDNDNGSTFFITEYNKEYEVTIAQGITYGTYYSDYRLVIPNTVKAYIATELASNYVALEEVTGVLPAHTGVLLEGDGTHTFVTSAAEPAAETVVEEGEEPTAIAENLFKGTTTKTLIQANSDYNYYVLANGASGVGLYRAKLNKDANGATGTTHFYNNANKVYLPVPKPKVEEPGQQARALTMRFTRGGNEGTTEVELPTANGQQPTVIYDLTGRRIPEIVEKGIYIVNGKKVIVK